MHWSHLCPPGLLKKGKDFCMPVSGASDRMTRRFPVISGFRVSWDSRRSPGQRVLGVWLIDEIEDTESGHSGHSTPRLVDGRLIERNADKTYKIVTRQYMAEGHDGFTALKNGKHIIDDEQGQLCSAIVRKYLMGTFPVSSTSVGYSKPA